MLSKFTRLLADFRNWLNSGSDEELEIASEDLRTLLLMSQNMPAARDVDEVLGFLLGKVHKRFGISCGVLMIEEDKYFRVRAHRGFGASFVSEFEVPLGRGAASEAFSSNKTLILANSDLEEYPEFGKCMGSENWNSLFLCPIVIQNQTLGIFVGASAQTSLFKNRIRHDLEPYIQVISIGINNALMVEKMEKFNRRLEAEVLSTTEELTRTNNRLIHRVRELKALYEITVSAGMSRSLQEIFKTVSTRLQELFDAEYMGFFINQSSKNGFIDLVSQHPSFLLPREVQDEIRISSENFLEGGTLSKLIFEAYSSGETKMHRGLPVSLQQELPDEVSAEYPEQLEKIVFESMVAVPLKTSQKTLGIMVLMNPMRTRPSVVSPTASASPVLHDEELRTLTLVASRIASSIENFQLDMQIQNRLADLSTLQEISESYYATPILEFDLGKIVKIIVKSLPCDYCVFMFFDPSSAGLVVQGENKKEQISVISTKDEKNPILQAFKEGNSRIIDDVQLENVQLSGPETGLFSLMLVPLKIEKRVIGILKLGSKQKSYFTGDHLRLSQLIADRASVIIQNAQLYENIWHANKELERLNQMKTEFVSMVSHELRTPMTAIKGFVDIILNEEAGPISEQQRKFLKITHNSINRLTLLISDLLDLSRIESGKMKIELFPTEIEKLLHECAEVYKSTIESKKLQFSLEIEKKLPVILADEGRIKQVIDNLLSNALKFTAPDGKIKVIADDMGDYVLVGVSDTGPGIKKEDQEKIFEKFYQVDSSLTRQVGGTGLGLAICKSIIEMHNGRIWVESEPGKGSTFRFLLPRLRQDPLDFKEGQKPGSADKGPVSVKSNQGSLNQ